MLCSQLYNRDAQNPAFSRLQHSGVNAMTLLRLVPDPRLLPLSCVFSGYEVDDVRFVRPAKALW